MCRLRCGASVTTSDLQDQSSKGRIADLNEHMQMICHPAVRMQSRNMPLEYLRGELIKVCAVSGTEKDVLAVVTA